MVRTTSHCVGWIIQVLIDREVILSGAATGGEQPWKYYDLGDGYCAYDFFA
ncbi:hypothetical protein [Actinokineospora sp. UTMC 2448]|uniref:hypothetical protein n=1 Tax=Actinokineospora sp. UTMC 2448 TaxID=2268449 RepID=UPI0021646D75|nr:hypothetical protein [Actinokineospora sp. UTMC 2448]